MTAEYYNDDEHTHRQKIPFLVWALLVGLLILTGSVAALSVYLIGRAALADQRNQRSVQAVCAVLNSIPASQRIPSVRKARHIDDCKHVSLPHVRSLHPSQHPTTTTTNAASSGPLPSSTVVIRRTGDPDPQTTVTRTAHPQPSPPRPSHSPSHTPSPSPTQPSCLNLPKPLPSVCR